MERSARSLPQPVKIALKTGSQVLNLQLFITATQQQVKVEDNAGPGVSTEAANNASAVVLRGSDLDALSDNPDDLAADLQALAGPAAGPNGGSIFIDGFSGGQLPPKVGRELRPTRRSQGSWTRFTARSTLTRLPGTNCSLAITDAVRDRSCSN